MMERFWVKNPLYPVVSIAVMLTTFVGALLMARSVCGAVFLAAVYLLFAVFGYGKNCLRLLPFLAGYLLLFSAVFYVCSGGNLTFTGQMVIRLAGVVIAAIPGLSLPPVALVRSLTALHCPRLLTLGMLISMSFVPVLSAEIRQVRNAMKTRGVISVFNPTVFYRAFFIPLIVRLVNISDTWRSRWRRGDLWRKETTTRCIIRSDFRCVTRYSCYCMGFCLWWRFRMREWRCQQDECDCGKM